MNQDRIGTALLVLAAAWYGWLVADLPSLDVEVPWRNQLIGVAIFVLLLAVFPRHIHLTGTVLAFAVLGLGINLVVFEYEALEWKSIVPVAMIVAALWLRRERLDLKDVVGVASIIAFGLAVIQPDVILWAGLVIAAANALLWLVNNVSKLRSRA